MGDVLIRVMSVQDPTAKLRWAPTSSLPNHRQEEPLVDTASALFFARASASDRYLPILKCGLLRPQIKSLPIRTRRLDDVIRAYEVQVEHVERQTELIVARSCRADF
jgi:hypothetical protein